MSATINNNHGGQFASHFHQAPASSFGHGNLRDTPTKAPPDPQHHRASEQEEKKRSFQHEPPAYHPLNVRLRLHHRVQRPAPSGGNVIVHREPPLTPFTQPPLGRDDRHISSRTPPYTPELVEKPHRSTSNLLLSRALSFNPHSISEAGLRRTVRLSARKGKSSPSRPSLSTIWIFSLNWEKAI